MTKEQRDRYIHLWNIQYPYDRVWRVKYQVPLFSDKHRDMTLLDILMDYEEDILYKEAIEEQEKAQKLKEEGSIFDSRDKPYIQGQGNWLKASEDSLSDEEQDDLFDKIKI